MRIQKQHFKKKPIIIAIIILACIGAIAAGYSLWQSRTNNQNPEYTPPTKEEQVAGEVQKEKNIAEEKQIKEAEKEAQQTPALKKAEVIVTDASFYQYDGNKVEVRAYIANVYEDGGTCTAVFTQNGQTVTAKGAPFKDVSTTQCGAMDIPRSQFTAGGEWQVVVSYVSATASGQSAPKVVTIK